MITDPELRATAIKAGVDFYHQLSPALRGKVMSVAADAYSAAWEGSQHRVIDHQRALQAAVAAAAPLLIADHYVRLDGPPTIALEHLAVGMVIKIPSWGQRWVRLTSVGPVVPSGDSKRDVQVAVLNGKKAGSVYTIILYSGDYEIRPGGS